MHFLLGLTFLCLPLQFSQPVDSTQITLLRYQLQEQLQNDVQATETRLHDELEKFKNEIRQGNTLSVQTAKEEIGKSVNSYLQIGAVVVVILTFLGYGVIRGFINRSIAKFDKEIEDAIYRIDPRDMPIKLPATGMDKQFERLQRLEFRNLSKYKWLDESCTRNAIVYLATGDKQAEELKKFIVNKNLTESEDLVFVVYTKGARITSSILGEIDNVTFANSHLTLVQALFVAARGMVR